MARISLALLQIGLLLACPHICLGQWFVIGETEAPICHCCGDGEPHPVGSQTPQPAPEQGGDCACHGAIACDVISSNDVSLTPVLVVKRLSLDDAGLADVHFVNSASLPAETTSPFFLGQDVCALTCTFLI